MMQEFESLGCLKGGRLIYSQWPGYLDRDRVDIRDWCTQQELNFEILHTSGHADIRTLIELARSVEAKRLIPIHTDSPLAAPETAAAFLLDQPPSERGSAGEIDRIALSFCIKY